MEAQVPQLSLSSNSEQMWLASRLLRRQVVNMSTLEPVGRVADVILDPERCCVAALSVQLTPMEGGFLSAVRRVLGRYRTVGAIGIEHVIALSGDVVMVDSNPVRPSSLQRVELGASLCAICELTILSLRGTCIGSLADVLVDSQGRMVTGYVVNPTKQAESFLLPLDELLPLSPPQTEGEAAASEVAPLSGSPPAELRVIPASPRVRIGDTLIVVVDDVEPLRQEAVAVATQAGADTARAARSALRSGHHNGFYWRRTKQGDRH